MRAAFDLLDTTPGIRVTRRSLVWSVEGEDELVAAFALEASLDVAGLQALGAGLQARLAPEPAAEPLPLVVELLWAHDPQGKPSVAATPPSEPDGPQRPPLPGGHIWLHPDVPVRAGACSPLSEVAGEARDPATTRFTSEYLYTIAPPLLERPLPLPPGFAIMREVTDAGVLVRVTSATPSDLLAAGGEALANAPLAAQPLGPSSLRADAGADTRVTLPLAGGESPTARMQAWLELLAHTIVRERLLVRRIVVLTDTPAAISGVVFAARAEHEPKLARPRDVVVDVEAASGRHRLAFALA
jgi:hypothetical protein